MREQELILNKTVRVIEAIHTKIVREGYVDAHVAQECVREITHIFLTSDLIKDQYRDWYRNQRGGGGDG